MSRTPRDPHDPQPVRPVFGAWPDGPARPQPMPSPQSLGGAHHRQPVGYGVGPRPVNWWGVASLLTAFPGGCIPFLGSAVAILLGVAGIRRARAANAGTIPAVFGIILGGLGLGVWVLLLVTGVTFGREQKATATRFINDVSNGNAAAAVALTDGSIAATDLDALHQSLKPWGAVTDVTTNHIAVEDDRTTLEGTVTFTTAGKKAFDADLVKQGAAWKVTGLHFD